MALPGQKGRDGPQGTAYSAELFFQKLFRLLLRNKLSNSPG